MQTLLILHGWQSSREKWQKVKECLEKEGIRVVVPDLPGFKKENELEKAWSLDDYVDWVKQFIERNVDSSLVLLGHSFGGRVAIKFASKYPEKLSGLILVSAAGVESENSIRRLKKKVFKYSTSPFKKLSFLPGYALLRNFFYRFIIRETDYLMAKGYLKATFKKTIDENLTPLLQRIGVPTLIIWGSEDVVLPLGDGKLMAREIKGSNIEIMRGVGHNPHREAPEKLSGLITEFFKSHDRVQAN